MNVSNPPVSNPPDHTSPPIPPKPLLTVNSSSISVFRSVSNSGVLSYPWFSDLYTPWVSATSDMSKPPAATGISSTTSEYEIDFFIVAYAFTPEQTTYSQPVPWGVISPLEVQ
jgi:hypothetical protein